MTETYTVNQLSILCRLERRTVAMKLAPLMPAKVKGRHGYKLAEALPLLVRDPDASDSTVRLRDLKEREASARAESAERDNLERAKKLCRIEDAKEFWSEARIQIRLLVERSGDLTAPQKKRLLTAMAALRPAPPEPC